MGPQGAGLARALADPRIVVLGTLSKAFGWLGGFIAGPATAIELLINRARTFIFDTAMPPSLALAWRVARLLRVAATIAANASTLTSHVCGGRSEEALGFPQSPIWPIVPLVLGSEERALRVSEELEAPICVPAIRPPTVPAGTSRMRITCVPTTR